uniref:Uncharacterized protein n=1 Tax=viral metagenome TaxID=1070528 RepID=A0A6M3JEW2_9ZZZZ
MRTDRELWCWIRDGGGIRPDLDYQDSTLTGKEKRREYAYLDRKDGEDIDRMGADIGVSFPEFGIHDGEGLREWLQGYAPLVMAEKERGVDTRDDEQVGWSMQAAIMGEVLRRQTLGEVF